MKSEGQFLIIFSFKIFLIFFSNIEIDLHL